MRGREPDWDGLILRACRYFGQTPEYWNETLTLTMLAAQNRELAENPPAEAFLAAYFEAQGWWRRPGAAAEVQAPDLPQSQLPEYEP